MKKIIVTGGAGFIGSAVIWELNRMGPGSGEIIVVDHLNESDKWKNLVRLKFADYFEKDDFLKDLADGKLDGWDIDAIFHIGACSSTIHPDKRYYIKNNFEYSKFVAEYAFRKNARFIYASSAATYGSGEEGFSDDENLLEKLRPLNMYGYSKHLFDLWLKQNGGLKKAAGLKYFNVFGPNEYHKGEMRSFVVKACEQIAATNKIRLFRSHRADFKDGEQKRDFIYIKDASAMTVFFYEKRDAAGIYNIGTGEPHTFNELVGGVFDALGLKARIDYIDMPPEIKNQYQYFTKAEMSKLKAAGYRKPFYDFAAAVKEYVKDYILPSKFLADYPK